MLENKTQLKEILGMTLRVHLIVPSIPFIKILLFLQKSLLIYGGASCDTIFFSVFRNKNSIISLNSRPKIKETKDNLITKINYSYVISYKMNYHE